MQVSIPPTTINLPNFTPVTYGSANKEPNDAAMQLGILKEIKYPAGGKTSFIYEANSVNILTSVPSVKLRFVSCTATIGNCCGLTSNTSQDIAFTASELLGATFDLRLSNIPSNAGFPPPTCSNVPDIWCNVDAYQVNGNKFVGSYGFNAVNNGTTHWIQQIPLRELEDMMQFNTNEQYYFVLQARDAYAEFTLTVLSNTYQNKIVGGLRIKEIRSHDNLSASNDIVRTYDYLLESDPTVSSGILFRSPVYAHYLEGIAYKDDLGFTGPDYPFVQLVFSEQSVVPLSNFEGFHCGYKYVKENLNGNGWKKYTFFSQQSTQANANQYPRPPDNINIGLGKMEDEKTYAQTGDLLARTLTYKTQPNSSFNAAPIYKITSLSFPCFWEGKPGDDGQPIQIGHTVPFISPYTILTDAYKIDYTVETLDGVTATTHYFYDAADRFQMPVATQMVNSDYKVTRTSHKYVHDYSAGCVREQLLAKNIINQPWETVVTVNDVPVSGERTEYAAFSASGTAPNVSVCSPGSFPRPYWFYKYETNLDGSPGVWDLVGTISAYNPQGLPASFKAGNAAANWPSEDYTWSSAGLIQSRKYLDYTWSYDYHPGTRLVSKIRDKDGQETWFDYDPLMRLSTVYARPANPGNQYSANVKKEHVYQYPTATVPGHIRTTTVYTPVAGSNMEQTEEVAYFDGLGRNIQQVSVKSSPQQRDVVTATLYDNQGRAVQQFVPFHATTTNGAYLPNFPLSQPSATTAYEASPLNRVVSSTPPSWYATLTAYGTNTAPITHPNGTTYAPTTLMAVTVTDPNGNKNITYKDKKGRTLLSHRSNATGTETADTYSSYDDKGRLVTVYPPGADNNTTELLFNYAYDASDNIVSKKVPDKAPEAMQYNDRDLLAFYQDGNMAQNDHWMMTEYDDYGRPTKTGFSPGGASFSELLTETTYDFAGRVQESRAKILDDPFSNNWNVKQFFYDAYGRAIGHLGNSHVNQTVGSNNAGNTYDFADNILETGRYLDVFSSVNSVTERFTFDHRGRKTAAFHKVNNRPEETVAQYIYNHRNFLMTKRLNQNISGGWMQNVDFTYNQQGWLTAINQPCWDSPTSSAVAEATASNLSITVWPGTAEMPEEPGKQSAVVKVSVSGKISLVGQAPQTFARESWHGLLYEESDTAKLGLLPQAPAVPSLGAGVHIEWQKTINPEGLATFYETLRGQFLAQVSEAGALGQDLAVQASAMQQAVEAALAPIALYAAQAANIAMSQSIGGVMEGAMENEVNGYDEFGLRINYDVAVPALNAPQNKNGNITSIEYHCMGTPFTYGFQYDFLDRMTKGTYAQLSGETGYSAFNHYNEEVVGAVVGLPAYDKRGNIQGMRRNAEISYTGVYAEVDAMAYTYENNRLAQVEESGGPFSNYWLRGFRTTSGIAGYGYDANGNMIFDGHKGISIEYNHLNLPKRITFADGRLIEYLYDANGAKLRKTNADGSQHHYFGGIEYVGDVLDAVYFAEGRYKRGSLFVGQNQYDYDLKDHLGNTWVTAVVWNHHGYPLTRTLDQNRYYPFGMLWEDVNGWAEPPFNPYTYNGKELDQDLQWYDYGARWYDAAVGRWWAVDPMANKYTRWSPYNYAANNPILFIDPNGMDIVLSFKGNKDEKEKNRKDLESTINKGLGGYATVSINKKGKVTIGGLKDGASDSAKALHSTLTKANTAPKDVKIDVVSGSTATTVGSTRDEKGNISEKGTVDVGDLKAFDNMENKSGVDNAASGASKFAHEVEENYQLQAMGEKNWDSAHGAGIAAENAVSGSTRDPNSDTDRSSDRMINYSSNYNVKGTAVSVNVVKYRDSRTGEIKTTVTQRKKN